MRLDSVTVIDGQAYTAGNVGGNTWMIKRWKDSEQNDYIEALISFDAGPTITELEAIEGAISRSSWA